MKAGCKLVLRNGVHTETINLEEPNENENIEFVLLDVINESEYNISLDQASQVIEHEQMDASSEEEVLPADNTAQNVVVAEGSDVPMDGLETIVLPWVNRLRRVTSQVSVVELPASNKNTVSKGLLWLEQFLMIWNAMCDKTILR